MWSATPGDGLGRSPVSETSPKRTAEQRELSAERHPTRVPTHLALRYSDSLFRIRNVLERHAVIANRHGAVWFGKIGQPIGQASGRALQDQIADRTPTFVFLLQRSSSGIDVARCDLLDVAWDRPSEDELIPDYYDEDGISQFMKSWVKISSITEGVPPACLSDWELIRSGRDLADALRVSMGGVFFVREMKNRST